MIAVSDLDTPAVVVDLDVMAQNIRRVQGYLDRHGVGNRPHIKSHKIPAIGRMQMEAGAIGISCQKLGEVEVFVNAGVSQDVLLTYNVLGQQKTDRLMAVAKKIRRMAVTLDNEVVARGLSEAGMRHGVDVEFLVECDTGFGRNGVQSPTEAYDLARSTMRLPRMNFLGLMTYPNRRPDAHVFFEAAIALFQQAGIPVPIVSGGGSVDVFSVQEFPMLTEHRAGAYVYNDRVIVESGTATWADCAMHIRTTVVSRPAAARAILDAGNKVFTSGQYSLQDFGYIVEYPKAIIAKLSDEHATVDLSACDERPAVGEVLSVIANRSCVVSNMVDEVYGARRGRVEVVWPVEARGRVR